MNEFELIARLNAVLRRKGAGISTQTVADLSVHPGTREVRRAAVRIDLTTHDAGGITANDFELAAAMDRIAGDAAARPQ